MSAHTKGPWSFRQSEDGDWHLVSGDGITFQSDAQYYPWCSGNKADWLLQAAAPELLDELINLTARFKAAVMQAGTDEEFAELAVTCARAAIAKAVEGAQS